VQIAGRRSLCMSYAPCTWFWWFYRSVRHALWHVQHSDLYIPLFFEIVCGVCCLLFWFFASSICCLCVSVSEVVSNFSDFWRMIGEVGPFFLFVVISQCVVGWYTVYQACQTCSPLQAPLRPAQRIL
jgi:hypothetical protein